MYIPTIRQSFTAFSVRLSLLVRCIYTNHKTIFHCVFCTIVSACSLCIYQPEDNLSLRFLYDCLCLFAVYIPTIRQSFTAFSVRLSLLVRCVYIPTIRQSFTAFSVRLSLLVRCVYIPTIRQSFIAFSVRLSLLVRCVYIPTIRQSFTAFSVRLSLLVRCVYTNQKTIFHCVFCTIVSASSLCIYQP